MKAQHELQCVSDVFLKLGYRAIGISVSISRPFNWGMYKKAAKPCFFADKRLGRVLNLIAEH
jgi:hypothetical protein